ncbi:hypothetical protein DPMN_143480 [Dreissena polymorpha]|uniref:Uncharacterized protein n=1 Tax=Dreissena polymorpha TaxID=45954 RepID=A0A9D4GGA5_DREPO|nr:hypothetical protein DPMN_143480 [Dreissena polymorpha]
MEWNRLAHFPEYLNTLDCFLQVPVLQPTEENSPRQTLSVCPTVDTFLLPERFVPLTGLEATNQVWTPSSSVSGNLHQTS